MNKWVVGTAGGAVFGAERRPGGFRERGNHSGVWGIWDPRAGSIGILGPDRGTTVGTAFGRPSGVPYGVPYFLRLIRHVGEKVITS